MKLAIVKYWRDFVTIILLFLLAGGVSAYILDKQRLTLPSWVPGIGKDFFEFEAAFSNAQAVTPGQGQTVNVAGIKVGEISKVRLDDGKAVLSLRLENRFGEGKVFRDADMLLRPKTGLRDMVVELDPGSRESGAIPEGYRFSVGQTAPDVNLDEILAVLDDDTRTYLRALISGAGQGLDGRGADLAQTFRRFEPTARDLRRINESLARRRRNIKRVIHNFSLLVSELGSKDDQIAGFVDNSNAVFTALANQDAALKDTLRELPSALGATRSALDKSADLAAELGPATRALLPSARRLAPTLRSVRPFLRETTPVLRDEIRPLTRAALPVVTELRPAMRDLSAATPDLVGSLKIVNELTDLLAYNPPGEEEGFLFWLSWVNHMGTTVFDIADAHGPIRRGLLIVNCNALDVLDNVAAVNPALAQLVALVNFVRTSAVCPSTQFGGGKKR